MSNDFGFGEHISNMFKLMLNSISYIQEDINLLKEREQNNA